MTQTNEPDNGFERLDGAWSSLGPFNIEKVVDSTRGLEVFVCGTGTNPRKGVFVFGAHYGYRNFQETAVLNLWRGEKVPSFGVYRHASSELLDWATSQSVYEKLPEDVEHFSIISLEDILDVLAFEAPSFSLRS